MDSNINFRRKFIWLQKHRWLILFSEASRDFSRERLHFHRNCSRNRKEDSAVGEYDDYL